MEMSINSSESLIKNDIVSVPWVSLENRPYPGLLPAMDGSVYIENNKVDCKIKLDTWVKNP